MDELSRAILYCVIILILCTLCFVLICQIRITKANQLLGTITPEIKAILSDSSNCRIAGKEDYMKLRRAFYIKLLGAFGIILAIEIIACFFSNLSVTLISGLATLILFGTAFAILGYRDKRRMTPQYGDSCAHIIKAYVAEIVGCYKEVKFVIAYNDYSSNQIKMKMVSIDHEDPIESQITKGAYINLLVVTKHGKWEYGSVIE